MGSAQHSIGHQNDEEQRNSGVHSAAAVLSLGSKNEVINLALGCLVHAIQRNDPLDHQDAQG